MVMDCSLAWRGRYQEMDRMMVIYA